MTEYKRTGVCNCGATFEAKDRWQRSCDACVEAKKEYQAQHPRPLRPCDDCGVETRDRDHGRCRACAKARYAEASRKHREFKKQLKEERERQKQGPAIQSEGDWKSAFLEWFDTLPDDQQEGALGAFRRFASDRHGAANFDVATELNPEEIPHADQDVIDSNFAQLMKGFDL